MWKNGWKEFQNKCNILVQNLEKYENIIKRIKKKRKNLTIL